jgi:hypothetical protein
VDTLIINGRVVVEGGRFTTLDLNPIVELHRQKARQLTGVADEATRPLDTTPY